MAFENPQTQTEAVYAGGQSNYGVVDASQPYYQTNFPAPPVTTQPIVRPFIPATPPALKNADQFLQPTLGSQLYPGTANPAYQPIQPGTGPAVPLTSQPGSVPGHKMPHVVAPTPPPKGFMPVNSGVVQRPGVGPMQPPSPHYTCSSTTYIHQNPVIATLTRLFNETSEVLGGSRANPAKKREIEDNSRKLGALFAKLNSEDISKNAADKLVQLCQALDNGDFSTALQIQVLLTTSEWDECNFWLATLKRMIKTSRM
ncbi:hypothetical protein FH972_010830 [Carpinus fangiana]|uniref:SRA1/Sec31 domain-containing protein n=1 Tax=Carpinus fangiana TaxID=176857 RepID=A0A660KSK7_9ROSI|nr:hypothetical protein FH972_010830 [Carpinus fangiana]